jgi:hypothetical protein
MRLLLKKFPGIPTLTSVLLLVKITQSFATQAELEGLQFYLEKVRTNLQ